MMKLVSKSTKSCHLLLKHATEEDTQFTAETVHTDDSPAQAYSIKTAFADLDTKCRPKASKTEVF